MVQRDIIKDQVEQLGRVLGKITALLFDLDTSGDIEATLLQTKKEFNELLGDDLDSLLRLPPNEFNELLETKFHGDEKAIEKLADMLHQIGLLNKDKTYLQKAVAALEFAHLNSQVYSIERFQKLQQFRRSIASLFTVDGRR